jgi:hypothetical protein
MMQTAQMAETTNNMSGRVTWKNILPLFSRRRRMEHLFEQVINAEFPGLCYVCGQQIFKGDLIARTKIGGNPIALHAPSCAVKYGLSLDPKFQQNEWENKI